MTQAAATTDYTDAYQDSSDWCHGCNADKPKLDRPSGASPSGVQVLRVGTTWDCGSCGSRWTVARIEDVGIRWMTFGAAPETSA